MDRAAFIRDLQRRPYDKRELNCWHVATLVERELFGRELPLASPESIASERARANLFIEHPARREWVETWAPEDGALALLGRVPNKPIHAGVWLSEDGGVILHSDEPHGIVLDVPSELAASRRWRITYLVPRECSSSVNLLPARR